MCEKGGADYMDIEKGEKNMDYTNLKQRMEKSIGAFQEKLSEIRAGRANPAILNKVKVDYYEPADWTYVPGFIMDNFNIILVNGDL